MNARFLYVILLCIVLLFSGASYAAPAQTITVSGAVTNSITRNPISGATVSTGVSGVSFKAVTDDNGKYSLNISFDKKPLFIILVASKQSYLPSIKFLTNIQPGRSYTANFSLMDISPPSKPVVTDDGDFLVASNILHAKWSSQDPESGIKQYYYSIGTAAGTTDLVKWTSAGTNTEITVNSLSLIHNKTYYFNVRAINGIGLISPVGSSDGITINAHIPEISRIIPYSDSTFTVGDNITIEASAQDQDNDPIQYQFSVDAQIKQPFSSSNTYNYTVEPSTDNKHRIKVEARDDKNGLVSQEVTYNVLNVIIDTTPPPAPAITTNPQSSSLNSIEASWQSDDPESGIIEYQYAIGTTPGGTDIVYWTTYGNNTQAFLSDLNLTKGQPYYLSVVAKNGAGLKSPVTTSPAITASEEPYIKIYYPYQNAIITDREVQIKGVAEGVSRITINGKQVAVNADGAFSGPTLVAPGYAARNNITSSDPNYIIMSFPGPTTITASASGEEDTISFYYYQLFVKSEKTIRHQYEPYKDQYQSWNNDALVQCPFSSEYWQEPNRNLRRRTYYIYGENWSWGEWSYYVQNNNSAAGYSYIDLPGSAGPEETTTSTTIHSLPAINGQVQPMVLVLGGLQLDWFYAYYSGGYESYSHEVDPSPYKVNGQPLKKLYGDFLFTWPYNYYMQDDACYVVLTDYQPDEDMELQAEPPTLSLESKYGGPPVTYKVFEFGVDVLRMDTVREIPYGSGNYVPVTTIPIFQPDDGKGRGPSLELVNMPFLKLKFNEEPSNSQINTLEAKLSIADETKTYNLTETAVDSGVFANSDSSFTLSLRAPTLRGEAIPSFNSNLQDELTCQVTSSFGSLNNNLFNLKESASDSLYFNDIKTFVTVTFNNELLPYQMDTLTIQYDNGMLASEETLTETSPDSLVFSNEDNTFTVKLNNYSGTLPDNLDITINNTDYLEISKAELILPKVSSNPYVYTNEPMDAGSDLPANNPLDDGQGVFKVQVKGLPADLSSDIISSLPINLSTDLGSKTLNLTRQADGSYMTPPIVLLPQNNSTTYGGIFSFNSTSGENKLTIVLKIFIEKLKDVEKGAFVGTHGTYGYGSTIKDIAKILHEDLGYTTNKPDFWLTKPDVINALPNYSVWYSLTDGTVNNNKGRIFIAIHVAYSWGAHPEEIREGDEVYPNDIAAHIGDNSYNLVFLNACLSADKKNGSAAAAFKRYFKTKAYLGWTESVFVGYTISPAKSFFRNLDNETPVDDAYIKTQKEYIYADLFLDCDTEPDLVIDLP